MLTRLAGAISDWQPSGAPPDDPLGTIRSAWNEIVGEDVARSAQPVALAGTALVIITASAAWSHQLAFLEREIIRQVRALGARDVERLRFRVGTMRTPTPTSVRHRRRTGASASAVSARPVSIDEAFGRLRSAVEAQRAAHAAAGGTFCGRCGGAIAAGARCRPCADAEERTRRERTERILFESPWLAPEDVLREVTGLAPDEYVRIRRRLLRSWTDELRLARKRFAARAPIDAVRIRRLASSYVLLETRIDPNRLELDSPVRANALGDLYPFIRAVETGSTRIE